MVIHTGNPETPIRISTTGRRRSLVVTGPGGRRVFKSSPGGRIAAWWWAVGQLDARLGRSTNLAHEVIQVDDDVAAQLVAENVCYLPGVTRV